MDRPLPAPPWWATEKWRAFGAIGTSFVVIVLSTTMSFVLLPAIAEDFDVTLGAVGWVVIVESLIIAAMLLPMGGVADGLGRRRVLVAGLAVFGAGSVLTGAAPAFGLLIAARIVMSIGNAMVQSVGTGLVVASFPPGERGVALGAQTTAVAVGAAMGPLLGGFALEVTSWRSLFLFMAVPTALSVVAALAYLPNDVDVQSPAGSVDVRGGVLSALAVVALVVTISNPFGVAWLSLATLAGAVVFVGLIWWFIRWELAHASPMLQLRLFVLQTFRSAVLVRFVGFTASTLVVLLFPVYLLSVRGLTSGLVGVILSLTALGLGLSAQLSGRLYDAIGPRIPTLVGLVIQGVMMLVLLGATRGTSPWLLAGLAFAIGVGQSMWNVPNNAAMMGSTSADSLGVVGAFTNVTRTMGNVIGQALGAAVVAGVMVADGFDIPLGDLPDVVGAADSFLGGWRVAFVIGVALLGATAVIAVGLPTGAPERR